MTMTFTGFLLCTSFRTPECCSTSVWWEDQRFTATCHLRTGGHSTTLLSTGEGFENTLIVHSGGELMSHTSTFKVLHYVLIDICPPSQELIIHIKGISSLLLGFALHSLGGVDCTPAESWKPVRPNKSVWPLMQQKLFNALMLVCLTGIFLDTFLE